MKKVLTIVVLAAALQLAVVSATYAAPPAWGPNCGGAYHCVEYGETLSSIGRMYNALPQCIADANGIWNPDLIFAGTVLYIPATCPPFHGYHQPVNCGWGCGAGYYPPAHPKPQPPCGDWGCGDNWQPRPTPYYGYDYTGYYYGHGKDKYSYTCGYNNNCW
ncbi:MAG: hypothetical protein Kow0031_25550 [Anaerolineae bacterium]